MKVITIANYDFTSATNRALYTLWKRSLLRHNPDAQVTALVDAERPFLGADQKICPWGPPLPQPPGNRRPTASWRHNVGFKLFNILNEPLPFVYVDMDAVFFAPLDSLPGFASNHPLTFGFTAQYDQRSRKCYKPYVNSGLMAFRRCPFTYDDLARFTSRAWPGELNESSDQGLIELWRRETGYDIGPMNRFEDEGWNLPMNPRLVREDGDEALWLPTKRRIRLGHWYYHKPWQRPVSPMFQRVVAEFSETNNTKGSGDAMIQDPTSRSEYLSSVLPKFAALVIRANAVSMSPVHYSAIACEFAARLARSSEGKVLVFGAGRDTDFWNAVTLRRVAIAEHDARWVARASEVGAETISVSYASRTDHWMDPVVLPAGLAAEHPYLSVLIDAPPGNTFGREQSVFAAAEVRRRHGASVFAHDYERPWDRAVCDKYLGPPTEVLQFNSDKRQLAFWKATTQSSG